jgi:hypothetical protein
MTCNVTDAGVTQRIVHNSSQFIQWVVVNIPENDVGLGETVLPFVESPPKNITSNIVFK